MASASNQAAFEAIASWPEWPLHVIALCGPAGSGKSHLAKIWTEKSAALHVAALPPDNWPEGPRVIVDDAELLLQCSKGENTLFHLYNWARETGGWVLLVARNEPNRWNVKLPDLKSRLATVPVFHTNEPDDILVTAILTKLLSDRQLRIDSAVLDYIVLRVERSYEALSAYVEALDNLALSAARRITKPLAREVFEALKSEE